MKYNLLELKQELKEELTHNILPFWMEKMVDEHHGGYFSQITGKNVLMPNARKGAISNAGILWSFSSAALYFQNQLYTEYAERAKDYAFEHFFDTENGGTYWMLHADGTPADTKKQISSQAFFIYALAEYYRVTTDAACLDKAIDLFRLIEKYSFDTIQNGYFEAFNMDWKLAENSPLCEKEANEKKSLKTHLHILQAYTNLYREWKDEALKKQLKNIIELFLDKIINPETHHLDLFFDENWVCKSTLQSYGHDIESAWLLYDAAVVLGEANLIKKVSTFSLKIADSASEGIQPNGSVIKGKNVSTGQVDANCTWWSQAEAMVGFYYAYDLSKKESYAEKTLSTWEFIKQLIIDKKSGEWHNAISATGVVDVQRDKTGLCKSPLHNSRMCLELMKRIRE